MNVGIIDADLIGRKRHRFPNLVCMKLSAYHKENGNSVALKSDYNDLDCFDKVYIAKVFTDTEVPADVLTLSNVEYNGTGFFYNKANPLPQVIEHHIPDYHLYDEWIQTQIEKDIKRQKFDYYIKYAIGYLTRGCFRKCPFCVNQKYDKVYKNSDLTEFIGTQKKICLLDDNFFGFPRWKDLLLELIETNLPFQFKQGLDERLLTEEKAKLLFNSKYDGDFIFAFDNIADSQVITDKLKLIRKHTNKNVKFYCLTAYDRSGKYDAEFWHRDILELLYRIEILMKYKCLPYVMRYERYRESPYYGIYVTLAEWCNQPRFFKKNSLSEFIEQNWCKSRQRYLDLFIKDFSDVKDFIYRKMEVI